MKINAGFKQSENLLTIVQKIVIIVNLIAINTVAFILSLLLIIEYTRLKTIAHVI